MSAYDPYRPKTQVGPHRVFVDPPPDPASEVPGHPDELQVWLREPGGDLAERARRVDLAEVVEMGRPGRMRDVVLDAVRWNRAVITDDVDDGDQSWINFEKTDTGTPGADPLEAVDLPPGATAIFKTDGTVVIHEATVAPDGQVVDDATVGPDGEPVAHEELLDAVLDSADTNTAEATPEADAVDEKPADEYQAGDVPDNAKDVVAWIQAAPDEGDAAERSQAAWLVEISRSTGVRTTVKAEIDKHLA